MCLFAFNIILQRKGKYLFILAKSIFFSFTIHFESIFFEINLKYHGRIWLKFSLINFKDKIIDKNKIKFTITSLFESLQLSPK